MGQHTKQTAAEVAEELGCSHATIAARLREMGIEKVRGQYIITGTIKKRLASKPVRKYERRNEK